MQTSINKDETRPNKVFLQIQKYYEKTPTIKILFKTLVFEWLNQSINLFYQYDYNYEIEEEEEFWCTWLVKKYTHETIFNICSEQVLKRVLIRYEALFLENQYK